MASDINEILIRIGAADDNAKHSLEGLIGLLEAVGSIDAKAEVDVTGVEGATAETSLLIGALRLLSGEDVKIDVDTQGLERATIKISGTEADVAGLMAVLSTLGHEDAEPEVKLKGTEKFLTEAALITGIMKELSEKHGLDFDVELQGAEQAAAGIKGLSSQFQGLGGAGRQAGSVLSYVGGILGPFGETLSGTEAIAAALIITIGTLLVGAVAALGASLLSAAAGAGVLATALAGALGPAAIILVGVFRSLAQVFQALQAHDNAQLNATQKRIQGDQQAVNAANARADAERNLERAQASLVQARLQALNEEKQAALDVANAEDTLANAILSQKQSKLDFKQAELDLKEFRQQLGLTGHSLDDMFKKFTDVSFDPSKINKELARVGQGDIGPDNELKLEQLILNVQKARQGEKDATDNVRNAQLRLQEAQQKELEFQKKGILASQQYASALQAVADAQRQLNRVSQQNTMAAQAAKTQAETKKLTSTEQALLNVIILTRREFSRVFGPAVQAVLAGLIGGLQTVDKRISPLRGSFRQLGLAMGRAVVQFINAITSPQFIKAFTDFANVMSRLAGPITNAFIDLITVLLQVAQLALPVLLSLVTKLVGKFHEWSTSASFISGLGGTVSTLVSNFKTWLGVLGSVAGLFLAFIKAATPQGQKFAGWIKKIADNLKDWLNSKRGREEISNFLKVAVPFTEKFLGFLGRVLVVFTLMGEIIGPVLNLVLDLLNVFLDGFINLIDIIARVDSALSGIINFLSKVLVAVVRFIISLEQRFINLGIKITSWLVKGIISAAEFIWKALRPIFEHPEKKLVQALTAFFNFGKMIIHKIADGVVSLVNFIWDKIKHLFDNLPDKLKKTLEGFFNIGVNIVKSLIHGIESKAKDLANTIKNLPGKGLHLVGKVLGIGSPSKVFMEIGDNVVEGFKIGIERNTKKLTDAIGKSLATPVVDVGATIPAAARAHAPALIGAGGIHIDKQVFNIPGSGDPQHDALIMARLFARRGHR